MVFQNFFVRHVHVLPCSAPGLPFDGHRSAAITSSCRLKNFQAGRGGGWTGPPPDHCAKRRRPFPRPAVVRHGDGAGPVGDAAGGGGGGAADGAVLRGPQQLHGGAGAGLPAPGAAQPPWSAASLIANHVKWHKTLSGILGPWRIFGTNPAGSYFAVESSASGWSHKEQVPALDGDKQGEWEWKRSGAAMPGPVPGTVHADPGGDGPSFAPRRATAVRHIHAGGVLCRMSLRF